jgi:hypothetical protein
MSDYRSYEDRIKAQHSRDGGIYDSVDMANDIGLLLTSLDLLRAQNAALYDGNERCHDRVGMRFVPLTRSDGSVIWFGDGVIVQPSPGTAAPGIRSTVIVDGVPHYVRESVEEVLAAFGHEVGDPPA